MTNLEALRSMVQYPVSENLLVKALLDRELDKDSDYSRENKKLVDLTYADVLSALVSSPNISEGGYQLSISDKSAITKVASGIYDQYGVSNPLKSKVTINDRSNYW